MKKEDFTTVIIDDNLRDQPRGLFARFLRATGNTIGWLFVLCPGCLVIWLGLGGILNERLEAGRHRTVSYGDDAIGWGWIFVGVGFWAIGEFCFHKTTRAAFRLTGCMLASVSCVIGVLVLFRRFWISSP